MRVSHLQARIVRVGAGAILALATCVPIAMADQWNDRTILTFSEPVMVPGATLQPGSYVFKLMDFASDRDLVRITTVDGSKVIATMQAVPMKRLEPKGDVVLKFAATKPGEPPAMKGWFYPGSIYGHQFIYPEQQAKEIAQRTNTVVLSTDVPGTDLTKGMLYVIDASGAHKDWHGDSATMREWDTWQRGHKKTASSKHAQS